MWIQCKYSKPPTAAADDSELDSKTETTSWYIERDDCECSFWLGEKVTVSKSGGPNQGNYDTGFMTLIIDKTHDSNKDCGKNMRLMMAIILELISFTALSG